MDVARPLPIAAAVALGIALGGFFDGIVLHQVLQWHHLLSALDRDGALDLRAQVVADGLFHAAMYVLAAVALASIARRRASLAAPGAGRAIAGATLVGFAVWQALDAMLAHWLLGLHRVRMDVAEPLVWDLGWLAVFGLVPGAIGAALWRAARRGSAAPRHAAEVAATVPAAALRSGAGPDTRLGAERRIAAASPPDIERRGTRDRRSGVERRDATPSGVQVAVVLAAVAVTAGWLAAGPAASAPGERAQVTVVLRDAAAGPRLLSTLGDDTRVVATDRAGTVWRLALDPATRPAALWRDGVLWVAAGPLAAGCAGAMR